MKMISRLAALLCVAICSTAATPARPAFAVDGRIALDAFVSLTELHVAGTQASLLRFVASAPARSGDWSAIEPALREQTSRDVPETAFYALPNGRYYVVGKGLQPVPVDDRPYFAQVFAGKMVAGDIVKGRSTGAATAIVAVPVRAANGTVIGLAGAGIDLTKLNALLEREMGAGSDVVFWATDKDGITALHSDARNILNEALSVPELQKPLRHMIDTPAGVETYSFKGVTRTVLYRHSALLGWTFGFGVVR